MQATKQFDEAELASFKATFEIFDKDKSGSIDQKELEVVLKNLGMSLYYHYKSYNTK